MGSSLKIAHLSDPHFGSILLHPNQFLSKKWIGNFNHFFFRNRFYTTAPLHHLPALLEGLHAEVVCITGDFTTTAEEREFESGVAFVKQFACPVMVLPGNHDCYTKKAQRDHLYYRYFPDAHLLSEKVSVKKIKEGWWWVGLDCTLATPPFFAYGLFTAAMEKALTIALSGISEKDSIVVANHYPLIPSNRPKHDLKGVTRLQSILQQFPNIKLYLHGHDHLPYFVDGRKNRLPLINNAGSCARKKEGGFSLFEIDKEKCLHKRYASVVGASPRWELVEEKEYVF